MSDAVMEEVTLAQVLEARDARAASQKRLLAAYGLPLVCLTMNIAGPVKRSGLIDFAFREALADLRARLGDAAVLEERTGGPAGQEALLVCRLPAGALKALAVDLESGRPAGRLLDLDVITPDGIKLSRETPRTCLVCGGPAAPCARSRAHGLPAVQAAARALLEDFAAQRLSELAVRALKDEVDLTPKPGLVDRRNNGAHRDMDRALFHRSAQALQPYFRRAVELGMASPDCMPALRAAGLEAESAMFSATGGVNTHKGAVYAFGLILASMGGVLTRGGGLFAAASSLAAAGPPPPPGRPAGRGARGEALDGFPHAREALEVLETRGPYAALLVLLARLPDANLLRRGGRPGLEFVRAAAADLLAGPAEVFVPGLEALDESCRRRNLSPGGSADLLALAFLLHRTGEIWRKSGDA